MTASLGNGRQSRELQAADFTHWHGERLFVAPFDYGLAPYKELPIVFRGITIAIALVSPQRYDEIKDTSWGVSIGPTDIHWNRPITYRRPVYVRSTTGLNGYRNIYLHRVLLGLPYRDFRTFVVNHINGHPFDCRDENMEKLPHALHTRKRRRSFEGVPPCAICR